VPIIVDWITTDDVSRCALAGELDLASEARVRRVLVDALASRPDKLVVDLSGVTFIDSTGLRVLLSVRNRAATIGTRVALAGIGPAVARTLEIANLGSFFEYDPN
jgi:anti-sigma B factor antagonist